MRITDKIIPVIRQTYGKKIDRNSVKTEIITPYSPQEKKRADSFEKKIDGLQEG
jgi:hypothetical protein